jgi:hypothetical protein
MIERLPIIEEFQLQSRYQHAPSSHDPGLTTTALLAFRRPTPLETRPADFAPIECYKKAVSGLRTAGNSAADVGQAWRRTLENYGTFGVGAPYSFPGG